MTEGVVGVVVILMIFAVIGGVYFEGVHKRDTHIQCVELLMNKPAVEILAVCK